MNIFIDFKNMFGNDLLISNLENGIVSKQCMTLYVKLIIDSLMPKGTLHSESESEIFYLGFILGVC